MSYRRRNHQEIARQDVVVGPSGPVEIYRADRNPHRGYLERAKKDSISTKYKNNRSELNTMRHLTVNGDKISYSNPHRNYIYHRQAFDWYNSRRAVVLDDMEEILPVPGSLSRPHVRSIYDSSQYFKAFSRYAPPYCDDEYSGSETENEPVRKALPAPAPVLELEPASKKASMPTVRFVENQHPRDSNCINDIIVKDIEKQFNPQPISPFKTTSVPQVIYHGDVRPDGSVKCKSNDVNQLASGFRSIRLDDNNSSKIY